MREWMYIAPQFLTSALDENVSSAAHPDRFNPGTHWMADWVGSRVDLDTGGVEKNLLPLPEIEPVVATQSCPSSNLPLRLIN
jgi:hypothetical protein